MKLGLKNIGVETFRPKTPGIGLEAAIALGYETLNSMSSIEFKLLELDKAFETLSTLKSITKVIRKHGVDRSLVKMFGHELVFASETLRAKCEDAPVEAPPAADPTAVPPTETPATLPPVDGGTPAGEPTPAAPEEVTPVVEDDMAPLPEQQLIPADPAQPDGAPVTITPEENNKIADEIDTATEGAWETIKGTIKAIIVGFIDWLKSLFTNTDKMVDAIAAAVIEAEKSEKSDADVKKETLGGLHRSIFVAYHKGLSQAITDLDVFFLDDTVKAKDIEVKVALKFSSTPELKAFIEEISKEDGTGFFRKMLDHT